VVFREVDSLVIGQTSWTTENAQNMV